MLGCVALCAGCLGAGSHECSNADHTQSWLCPANFACADAPTYCGAPGLIQECADKPDLAPCAYSSTEVGSCHGGLCTQCTPDLEGCPITGWTPMTSPTGVNLTSIWVVARGEAFAGGEDGTMLHYDGLAWKQQAFPMLAQGTAIVGIWGASATDVYAVAGTQVFHWDGAAWTLATSSPEPLNAIGGAGGVVTAVGLNATAVQLSGGTWTVTTNVLGLPASLDAVWAAGPDDIFAAGSAGLVLRYHNSAWSQSRAPSGPLVRALWGASGGDVYAVGDNGATSATIYHYDGAGWPPEPYAAVVRLYGTWGAGPGDIYACGQSGSIAHRDATAWTAMTTPAAANDMLAIGGSSATDVIAVGRAGTIWRYAGN